jgi:hypothetical protein
VACHSLPNQSTADEKKHVPLNNVAAKFKPGALAGFLKKPEAYHAASGMPNFRLSDDEANSLAAFLLGTSKDKQTKVEGSFPAGDAKRGEAAALALNCASCHPGMPTAGKPAAAGMNAIFGKDWSQAGCVAPADKRGKAPRLNLNDAERAALVAFSKAGAASLMRDTPPDYS